MSLMPPDPPMHLVILKAESSLVAGPGFPRGCTSLLYDNLSEEILAQRARSRRAP